MSPTYLSYKDITCQIIKKKKMLSGENMKIDGPMQIREFKYWETNIKSKSKHTRLKLYSNLYEILKKLYIYIYI